MKIAIGHYALAALQTLHTYDQQIGIQHLNADVQITVDGRDQLVNARVITARAGGGHLVELDLGGDDE